MAPSMPSRARYAERPRLYVPPFHNGDRMDRATFHSLYESTPVGFKAELIAGIVYMASPVSADHGIPHGNVSVLLGTYAAETEGVEMLVDTTVILANDSEPQPSVALVVTPEAGGVRFSPKGYLLDPPHLVIEIAHSSSAIDLHSKKRDYDINGVREYIVVVEPTKTVHWFLRGKLGFRETKPDADGVLKTRAFPGLWFLTHAAFDRRANRLLSTLRQGLASPEHAKFAAKLAKKLKAPKPNRS